MCACDGCGGACCKFVRIKVALPDGPRGDVAREWMRTRGIVDAPPGTWTLPAACMHLSADGRCTIYATRPQVCRDREVEQSACESARQTVKELVR